MDAMKSFLEQEAKKFRKAIICVIENGGFPQENHHIDRMNYFPRGCCDDSADLFAHYLSRQYQIKSVRIDGLFSGENFLYPPSHSWVEVNDCIIDLTADQFSATLGIMTNDFGVYVGPPCLFYERFWKQPIQQDCFTGNGKNRMDRLYDLIIQYMNM